MNSKLGETASICHEGNALFMRAEAGMGSRASKGFQVQRLQQICVAVKGLNMKSLTSELKMFCSGNKLLKFTCVERAFSLPSTRFLVQGQRAVGLAVVFNLQPSWSRSKMIFERTPIDPSSCPYHIYFRIVEHLNVCMSGDGSSKSRMQHHASAENQAYASQPNCRSKDRTAL